MFLSSKKTPALQATIHKISIIDLFKFYSVKKKLNDLHVVYLVSL